jgi:HSP20 family molecular chaperone IbpA
MATAQAVGIGSRAARAVVRKGADEYVIELDLADFTNGVLSVDACGPRLTVRGDALETEEDENFEFRFHEELEESFRLPDDADPDRIKVFYEHGTLAIHAPRVQLKARRLPIEPAPPLVNPHATPC